MKFIMRIDPLLRALADPTRLRIMRLLSAMELAVGELAQVLGQSQPRVSRHVRILCDAGLAERRKEGSWVFLRSAVAEHAAPPLGAAAARLLNLAEAEDASFAARCAEDPPPPPPHPAPPPAMPRNGTTSARSTAPTDGSKPRWSKRSALRRSAGCSMSARAPGASP